METAFIKYPVGLQDFKGIREGNFLYVDKTALIYRLVKTSKYVFLSRPRRFGKSLLTSTLHYYFEGRKELFEGLAMEQLEADWIQYPVLHFDLGQVKEFTIEELREELHKMLTEYEDLYNVKTTGNPGSRLNELIRSIYGKTGRPVALLIDEYDAPIMNVLHDKGTLQEVRNVMRNFYTSLKANERYLKFVFITGVSTFSQMGIFSELNNLKKITNNDVYAAICGITEQELRDNFAQGIDELASKYGYSKEEMLAALKDKYDGYHFSNAMVDIYNPFSLLNAFDEGRFGDYWFDSGTSTSLVNALQRYVGDFKLDLADIDSGRWFSESEFLNSLEDRANIIPLLYQTGYLTIKACNASKTKYVLGMPNSEVRTGLLRNLAPLYTQANPDKMFNSAIDASEALLEGDIDHAMEILRSVLKSIPYRNNEEKVYGDILDTERHFHDLFHVFFKMLCEQVNSEVRNSTGATDVVITTPKYVYVVEIKIDAKVEVALEQIDEKGYAVPYMAGECAVYKVGVVFSTKEKTLSEWKVVELKGKTSTSEPTTQ
jgi:AcrR family transcriptional regulator